MTRWHFARVFLSSSEVLISPPALRFSVFRAPSATAAAVAVLVAPPVVSVVLSALSPVFAGPRCAV